MPRKIVRVKKKLLEDSIVYEKVTFLPTIGLNGFAVSSALDITLLSCSDLKEELYQLSVILYPTDSFNEKFLIKLRDCVFNFPSTHPLKRWLKTVAIAKPQDLKTRETVSFLTEIINSQFNLITDLKVRNQIIDVIQRIPEDTLAEIVLKSYLYAMIGNISRSDNLLREFSSTSPRINWERSDLKGSIYHSLARDQIGQIFHKLSRHPADRKSFQLLLLYLRTYYNDPSLMRLLDDLDVGEVEKKLGLKYIERLAPDLVHFLRLLKMSEGHRFQILRTPKYSSRIQAYWMWPFLEIEPLAPEYFLPELVALEKDDQLWLIYLLKSEKLADLYSRNGGKSFLPGRRPFLKATLSNPHSFMLALYKLIELGDIEPELISRTAEHLTHE